MNKKKSPVQRSGWRRGRGSRCKHDANRQALSVMSRPNAPGEVRAPACRGASDLRAYGACSCSPAATRVGLRPGAGASQTLPVQSGPRVPCSCLRRCPRSAEPWTRVGAGGLGPAALPVLLSCEPFTRSSTTPPWAEHSLPSCLALLSHPYPHPLCQGIYSGE